MILLQVEIKEQNETLLVKSTIPLIKAVVALKGLEHDAQDKMPRDIKRKLQDVSPLLHKSSTKQHYVH